MKIWRHVPILKHDWSIDCELQSALEMRDKTVKDAMTPLESVFMLDINDTLGNVTMDKVEQRNRRSSFFEGMQGQTIKLLII